MKPSISIQFLSWLDFTGRISDPAQIRRVTLGVAAFSKRRFEKKTGEAAHFAAKSRARRSGDRRYSRELRRSTPECYLRRIGDAPDFTYGVKRFATIILLKFRAFCDGIPWTPFLFLGLNSFDLF